MAAGMNSLPNLIAGIAVMSSTATAAKIVSVKIGQMFRIVEGNHSMLDFGPAEGIARAALYFIRKYQFRFICFCGRPNPGMTYFRT